MKKFAVLATVLFLSSAQAATKASWGEDFSTEKGTGQSVDDSAGDQHMIESNVDSLVRGAWSFDKTKTQGSSSQNDTKLDLVLNYAYKIKPHWQIGTRLNYLNATAQAGDVENYGIQIGGFYNLSENLQESIYLSLFTGLEWQRTYGNGNPRDEIWKTTFAIGKRFGLARWKVAHLVYSPEVAFVSANSTTGTNVEYAQSISFRFLQFSLFF